jgi:hypothetical protein
MYDPHEILMAHRVKTDVGPVVAIFGDQTEGAIVSQRVLKLQRLHLTYGT